MAIDRGSRAVVWRAERGEACRDGSLDDAATVSALCSVGQFVGQIRGTQGNGKSLNLCKSTTYIPLETPLCPYLLGSSPISHPR